MKSYSTGEAAKELGIALITLQGHVAKRTFAAVDERRWSQRPTLDGPRYSDAPGKLWRASGLEERKMPTLTIDVVHEVR
jgi:hypothetical protein